MAFGDSMNTILPPINKDVLRATKLSRHILNSAVIMLLVAQIIVFPAHGEVSRTSASRVWKRMDMYMCISQFPYAIPRQKS